MWMGDVHHLEYTLKHSRHAAANSVCSLPLLLLHRVVGCATWAPWGCGPLLQDGRLALPHQAPALHLVTNKEIEIHIRDNKKTHEQSKQLRVPDYQQKLMDRADLHTKQRTSARIQLDGWPLLPLTSSPAKMDGWPVPPLASSPIQLDGLPLLPLASGYQSTREI